MGRRSIAVLRQACSPGCSSFSAFDPASSRVCNVAQAMQHKPKDMKPMIRIVQPNPMTGAQERIMREKTIPPIPPAVHAMPVARPCRLQNQWPIVDTLGVKRRHADKPPRKPNDKRN